MAVNDFKITDASDMEGLDAAPEIFIDGFQGVASSNGVAKINFFTTYGKPQGGLVIRCAFKMVATTDTLEKTHKALGLVLAALKDDSSPPRAGSKKRNAGKRKA